MKRIAVDIGGTFTDIIYIDEDTSELIVNKARSTPWDIGEAVMEAVRKIEVDLSEIELFIHGTTAGVNTLVQKKGSKVGLIATRGFTDILEMGRGDIKEVYANIMMKPPPLVPRYLRMPVSERTNYLGEILAKPDEKEVKGIIKEFKKYGVEAVAVCLMHSYANPENEQRLGEIIKEAWPEVTLVLSHTVAREIREYERMSSTAVNAYISKSVGGYIVRLNDKLNEAGFRGQLLVLGPSGVIGVEAVKEKAIYTLASGTIGGAAGAAHTADLCGIKDVVTMDVGGTSFDVSIIKDGANLEKHQYEVMGYPLLMAGIEVLSIGSGGGSIARVDAAGLLSVGPESAGADPGPMSYGLGGTEPTVTDAALVNGLLDPAYFLGGETRLDMESAQKGIVNIAKKLDISLNEAADGIISVACNNMTTATIEILIGQGFDPRDFALMAFGGGGGIFAANIARDMSISRVIIPPSPGVFCARGILTMDLVHTYSRAYSRLLDKMDIKELEGIYTELEKAALMTIMEEGISKDKVEFIRSMDMGYEGQHHQVETPVPNGELTEGRKKTISDSFERLHEARYGHRLKNAFTTVNIRLKAIGNLKEISGTQIGQGKDVPAGAVKPTRKVYLDGGFVEARIYEREGLLWGNTITGPAIVEEPFHTTVILPDQVLTVDKLGSLIIGTGGA